MPEPLKQRNALVEAHLDLVAAIAQRIASSLPPAYSTDDLISAGYLGLIQAAERFNGRGSFRSYARHRIRGAIWDWVRSSYRESTWEPLEHALNARDRSDPEGESRRSEQAALLNAAIARLGPREAEVIRARYQGLETRAATARKLRVSPGRISHIHADAVESLRKLIKSFSDITIPPA